MKEFFNKNKTALTVVSIITFAVSFLVCAYFGRRDVLNYLFSPTGENIGEVFKMPPTYTAVCFAFLAVMIGITVLGFFMKSKVLSLIPAVYEFIFILAFVLLAAFTSLLVSGEASQTVMDIIEYFLVFALIPVYGTIWTINGLFFIIFIPLVIFNIVAIVKAFKKQK